MDDARPEACPHERFQRIGIQRTPFPPYRLYLVTCVACGTTVSTTTLRRMGRGKRR